MLDLNWGFSYPWALLLCGLPLLVRWLTPAFKQKKPAVQVPYFQMLVEITGEKPQPATLVNRRSTIEKILLVLGWLCIVISLAKPFTLGKTIVQEKSGRDLMVAVDISASMSVKDFTNEDNNIMTRLAAVKRVLTSFAKNRRHDRLGLILFADGAYLQAPFTRDISTWLTLLNEAEIGMAGQRTALGDAIGLSISVFQQTTLEKKVLILLTDGNDTHSKVPAIEAAKVAKSDNIKIYPIAIGDPTSINEEKIDRDTLDNIAKITGGVSFYAINNNKLKDVYHIIEQLEPQVFSSQSFRPKTDVFHYPLVFYTVIYMSVLAIVRYKKYRHNQLCQAQAKAKEVNHDRDDK